MRNFALYIAECQYIRSMMSLRRSYSFDYSIRPSIDVSLSEARIGRYELKPIDFESVAFGFDVEIS
jgi:hypothetical protein